MRQKSEFLSAFGTAMEIFRAITNAVLERGGSDDDIRRVLTSRKLADEIAGLIVNKRAGSTRFLMKNISVRAESFAKDSFFGEEGPARFYLWDNFRNWVLQSIPETVPAFQGILRRYQFARPMDDSEILVELGDSKPLTPEELAATLAYFITRQAKGESGPLLTNGYTNFFYVQLEEGIVVVVDVFWDAEGRVWNLNANSLGVSGWSVGHCVFSRG